MLRGWILAWIQVLFTSFLCLHLCMWTLHQAQTHERTKIFMLEPSADKGLKRPERTSPIIGYEMKEFLTVDFGGALVSIMINILDFPCAKTAAMH